MLASNHSRYYDYWIRYAERRSKEANAVILDNSNIKLSVAIIFEERTTTIDIEKTIKSVLLSFSGQVNVLLSGPARNDIAELESEGIVIEASENPILASFRHYRNLGRDGYIMILFAGDEVSEHFKEIVRGPIQNCESNIIYWDEDKIDDKGIRSQPWFKPDWNELQFYSQDYLGGSCIIRISDIDKNITEQESQIYLSMSDAILFLVKGVGILSPFHIPYILSHRRYRENRYRGSLSIQVLESNLKFDVKTIQDRFGFSRIEWPLPSPRPSVSILIPTRDKIDLLSKCIDGLNKTAYDGLIETIIINNDSKNRETLTYFNELKQSGITILDCPGPFNYSSLNNDAATLARGKFLCFLNNDIEMIQPCWLANLLRYATQANAGAVGAKLLYPDHTIQHAGLVVGIGGAAGHMHRYMPDTEAGYFNQPHIARYVTAVTGACMVVNREKFMSVGGFDEQLFPVAFNDVDLCMKLTVAGWKNIYAPESVLIHHESKSRGSDMAPENVIRFRKEFANLQKRWNTNTFIDPYHNLNLSTRTEQYFPET